MTGNEILFKATKVLFSKLKAFLYNFSCLCVNSQQSKLGKNMFVLS